MDLCWPHPIQGGQEAGGVRMHGLLAPPGTLCLPQHLAGVYSAWSAPGALNFKGYL